VEYYRIMIDLFSTYKDQFRDLQRFWNIQANQNNEREDLDQQVFYENFSKRNIENPIYRSALGSTLNIIEFASLAPEQWVTSNVMDLFTIMLNCREKSLRSAYETRPKNLFIPPSIFMHPTVVLSEKKEIDLLYQQFDNLYSISNIDNNHWILVKIEIINRTVRFYDSSLKKPKNDLSDSHLLLFETIKEWLLQHNYFKTNDINLSTNQFEDNEEVLWNLHLEKNLLQQNNTYDCGIHAMINAYFVPDNIIVTRKNKIASCDALRYKIGMDFEHGYLKDPRIKNDSDYFCLEKSIVFGKPKKLEKASEFDPSKSKKRILPDWNSKNQQTKRKRSSSSSSSSGGKVIIIDLVDEDDEEDPNWKVKEGEENIEEEEEDEDAAIKSLELIISKQKTEMLLNEEKLFSLKNNKKTI
jgi:hypothetical protein